jgi:hypothetical protein
MELTCSDEQSYQFEMQTYQTIFLDFKYEPLNFESMEIRTNNKIPTTPFVVQPVTKLVSPLRGGIGLEIIRLPI